MSEELYDAVLFSGASSQDSPQNDRALKFLKTPRPEEINRRISNAGRPYFWNVCGGANPRGEMCNGFFVVNVLENERLTSVDKFTWTDLGEGLCGGKAKRQEPAYGPGAGL